MPSTLKEIADLCGVTKQTVKNNLRSMGLWDFHVTEGDRTTPAVVDDEATQKVVAVITARRKRPPANAPLEENDSEAVRLYEARVVELRAMLADQRAEIDRLRGQNDELSRQNVELARRVAEQADTIKALPAPDAVERAREDERMRIAEMGFFRRRRYLMV